MVFTNGNCGGTAHSRQPTVTVVTGLRGLETQSMYSQGIVFRFLAEQGYFVFSESQKLL